MRKKVVFCFYTNDHEINLGIGFISAALKRNGIDTSLVIYREIPGGRNDTPEEVVTKIMSEGPTVVAFSVMTLNWHHIKKLITLLRTVYPGPVVVGGYHAILEPGEVLAFPGVDAVCPGEGEAPLVNFVSSLQGDGGANLPAVEGLMVRGHEGAGEQGCWIIGDLRDFPYADYDIFDAEGDTSLREKHAGVFSQAGIFSLPVITGRGCPYRCTYCCNSVLIKRYGGLKRYLRKYPPAAALSNIKTLVARFQPQFIEFFDETFTVNKRWVREFCEGYRREIGLPFWIMNRIDSLDEPTVALLAESGLKMVLFGLESGDEGYRERYLNRKMSDRTIIEGARLLRKYGIIILTFNMFGMPFETKEMIEKTFALNEIIGPDAAFTSIFQPLPGTELGRISHENYMVLPHPDGMWDLHSAALDTPELPASHVREMFVKFRTRFTNPQSVQSVYERLRKIAEESALPAR